MAANDYYSYGSGSNNNNQHMRPDNYPTASPSPLSFDQQSLPPYTSSPIQRPANADRPSHASPFDTAFDDNAYPMNMHSNNPSSTNLGPYSSSTMNLPQQQQYPQHPQQRQDTTYYGAGNVSPDHGGPYPPEDIPLQNRPHKDAEMGQDHVYDAPGATAAGRRKKKGKVGLGQLGMIGADRKRIPWVVYILTIAQVIVFIVEIARNGVLTGTPIMIKPSFNPMIGPSPWVLVNLGARYAPCMHNVDVVQGSTIHINWPCPNTTSNAGDCTLSTLCGFGGVPEPAYDGNKDQKPEPNQWWRLIVPIFMHAGLIHIGFNMILQLTIGKEMEMAIGSVRFFLVYMSSGIFGCVLGANYAAEGAPSVGASGSLFGVIALVLLDLLYSWQERKSPVKDLLFILLDIAISFVLGLLPFLDNFAHIGGFVMGIGLGVCVLHSPNALRRRLGTETPYTAVGGHGVEEGQAQTPFYKNPMGFFKGRKPLWWIWWVVRVGCLLTVIIGFIVLLNNFYLYRADCSWCHRLSCIPVSNWCDIGKLVIEKEQTS
ncbi:related to membrane protein [Cephalotrichum gorgonifer]|uniref:Rhomboid-type serine protease n=1 Tax=Cephalotrichum gorgonifer TaxID=2041049 RepID=A0AAE8SSN7_9PEZI|nr:related to membrane protein [Cephalotrichum gorgonifer]